VRYGNKLKLSSDGGDPSARKCKRGCGGAYVAVWRRLRNSGIRRSVLYCAFDSNLASVAVKMFSHVINFIKKCYKCVLSVLFSKIVLKTVGYFQHKQGSFPSTLTGDPWLQYVVSNVHSFRKCGSTLKCMSDFLFPFGRCSPVFMP
jgi:hypothetical protein